MGKLIGPIRPGDFDVADFGILEAYELRKRVGPVVAALQGAFGSLEELARYVAYAL